MKKYIGKTIALFLLMGWVRSSNAQTLDQSQLIYNGGMSARTLAGYSEWQSFTAGLTGTLCQINMGFFNYINGTGTLKIFSGTGTGGTLRQSKTVSVYCASGSCMISFSVSVSVIAGQVYTFQFIPGAGIPDPYGVQVQVPGTYVGGQMAIIDPSGTYPLSFDMVFQTYVITGSLPVELISFTGENNNQVNHLAWSTASEINNDYFDVERSTDGEFFEKTGTVAGNGNSNQLLNYKFDDTHPVEGINYYRLKQVDFNGTFDYSFSIAIEYKSRDHLHYIISANGNSNYILHCMEPPNGIARIYDLHGRPLEEFIVSDSSSEISINLRKFPGGLYILKITGMNYSQTIKLVKN